MTSTDIERPNVKDIERINVLVHTDSAFSLYTAKSFLKTDREHCIQVIEDFKAKVVGHSSAPHFSVRGDATLCMESPGRIIEVKYVVPYGMDQRWAGPVSDDGTPVIQLEMPPTANDVNNVQPAATARSSSSVQTKKRDVQTVCARRVRVL